MNGFPCSSIRSSRDGGVWSVSTDYDEGGGTRADAPDVVNEVPRKLQEVSGGHNNAAIGELDFDAAGNGVERFLARVLCMSCLTEMRRLRHQESFRPSARAGRGERHERISVNRILLRLAVHRTDQVDVGAGDLFAEQQRHRNIWRTRELDHGRNRWRLG